MIKKTICFSNPARLSLHLRQLMITRCNGEGREETIMRPIEDIGVMVIESNSVTITSALLSYLVDSNVAVIVCDGHHMPSGLLLPIAGNISFTEKVLSQISCSLPLKKQLWQQTVSAKIANQASNLAKFSADCGDCMWVWSKSVKSGDIDNLEARAAVYYWRNLFPKNIGFRRGDEDQPINDLLNYGYAILRGVIARALVSIGLLTTIGLFHSNKYNPHCLADDIMEPYRPIVDNLVMELIVEKGIDISIDKDVKSRLLSIPVMDVVIGNQKHPLMVAASQTSASLMKCFVGEARKILYPVL